MHESREGAPDDRAPLHRDPHVIHLRTGAATPPDWASNGITFSSFYSSFAAIYLPAGTTMLNGHDAVNHQTSSARTGLGLDGQMTWLEVLVATSFG